MAVDPNEPPSLITLQIGDIAGILESGNTGGLQLLDTAKFESEGFAIRGRLGPPPPRAPWYPAGKAVTSKEFKNINRLLADVSHLTLVPTDEFERLQEYENRHDYTDILKEVRELITKLLIVFIEHHDVRTAKMRIFDDLKDLVKETWEDTEQLMFRTGALAELFKPNLDKITLSFNDLLPTYRAGEEVHKGMTIETTYQANFSMRLGTCILACLLKYNEQLKKSGAKDPQLRFQKEYRKKHPGEVYFLSDKFIEDLAFTAYILNIGLYHGALDPVLQQILAPAPPTAEQLSEIRRATYKMTLEIIKAHTILDLPAGRGMLRLLMEGEEGDTSASLVDPIVLEMLKVCMDYFTLTSQRPYRNRYHSSKVVEYIGTQLGVTYNIEAAGFFFSMLHPFPPGQVLTLNDAATDEPRYLVKVLNYSYHHKHPLFCSMPTVRVLQAADGAPPLAQGDEPVDLAQRHLADTDFTEGETVFMGSEEQGAFFLADVVDPSVPRVKFLRCITRSIPEEKASAVIGKMLDIPPGNPQRRLWKCHSTLYLADTVPTQDGEIFE